MSCGQLLAVSSACSLAISQNASGRDLCSVICGRVCGMLCGHPLRRRLEALVRSNHIYKFYEYALRDGCHCEESVAF